MFSNLFGAELHHVFALVEEVLVHSSAAERPDVAVLGDRAVGDLQDALEVGALRLSFHRGDYIGDA